MESGADQSLANRILDLLTPIASNGITSIDMDQLIAKVARIPTGLKVDREMITSILDPNKFPLIDKIEGNTIYLSKAPDSTREVNDDQAETEANKIENTAAAQAVKNIKT